MLIDKMNDKLQSLTLEDSSIRISDAKAVMSSTLFYIKTHFSHAAAGKLVGIDLVSEEVNKKTGGARRKEFTVIGGRPGMSKSGTCLNILEKNSMVLGKRGLVFSFEMSEEVCGERLIAQRLGTNLNNLHTGFFSKSEMTRIFRPVACKDCGGTELSQVVNYKEFDVKNTCIACGSQNALTFFESVMQQSYPFHIIDKSGLSAQQCISLIRAHKMRYPDLEYVIFDHLHAMSYNRGSNQTERIESTCAMLRDSAKDLDLAYIMAAQLNRSVELEPDKRPLLRHLRESGGIEQWSDCVLFLFRPTYYDKTNQEKIVDFEIDIAKQRNGPTGRVTTTIDLEAQKIYSNKQ